jgi:hypothetical protein
MTKRRDEEEQIAYHQAVFGSTEVDVENDERMTGRTLTEKGAAPESPASGGGTLAPPIVTPGDIVHLLPGAMGSLRIPVGGTLSLVPSGTVQSMTLKPGALQAYPAAQTAPDAVVYGQVAGGPTSVSVGWTDANGAPQASSIAVTVG